jgi:hypothetical protein
MHANCPIVSGVERVVLGCMGFENINGRSGDSESYHSTRNTCNADLTSATLNIYRCKEAIRNV